MRLVPSLGEPRFDEHALEDSVGHDAAAWHCPPRRARLSRTAWRLALSSNERRRVLRRRSPSAAPPSWISEAPRVEEKPATAPSPDGEQPTVATSPPRPASHGPEEGSPRADWGHRLRAHRPRRAGPARANPAADCIVGATADRPGWHPTGVLGLEGKRLPRRPTAAKAHRGRRPVEPRALRPGASASASATEPPTRPRTASWAMCASRSSSPPTAPSSTRAKRAAPSLMRPCAGAWSPPSPGSPSRARRAASRSQSPTPSSFQRTRCQEAEATEESREPFFWLVLRRCVRSSSLFPCWRAARRTPRGPATRSSRDRRRTSGSLTSSTSPAGNRTISCRPSRRAHKPMDVGPNNSAPGHRRTWPGRRASGTGSRRRATRERFRSSRSSESGCVSAAQSQRRAGSAMRSSRRSPRHAEGGCQAPPSTACQTCPPGTAGTPSRCPVERQRRSLEARSRPDIPS